MVFRFAVLLKVRTTASFLGFGCLLRLVRSIVDVVAMAAGFVDGLGWGDNSKGASQIDASPRSHTSWAD